ncbi:magnesium transporter CorA family protein [Aquabacterium sp. A3]|uniref:magnesium transporter CorA family protein n=1 Tax=Aquabacterium sp. A3 TaxID=3132829 RepID=UPI0031193151
MRIFHIHDRFTELPDWPATPPTQGFLWVTTSRRVFEVRLTEIQQQLTALAGGALLDLHVADLINAQLPSQFDYTSWYDVMVFRRLAAGAGTERLFLDDERGTPTSARQAMASIDTSPVGFALFDRVLLTVHPADCSVRSFFEARLASLAQNDNAPGWRQEGRGSTSRLPPNSADLMLRIINHMVDGYLDLRRLLTRQFGYLQQELLSNRQQFRHWQALLDSRNTLHLLEDICEDQRSAIQEWLDALADWPVPTDPHGAREREVLGVRSRDVQEHIERVLAHVRRLESSAEGAVQMHFSAQGSRTNEIMRTLTVLTAIFLPLNLITGVFGMNFDDMPLIHEQAGFWLAAGLMGVVVAVLVWVFRRRRYIGE